MKIRIGFGLGTRTAANDRASFAPLVDQLERLGFDSLWLSERITGEAPDPLIALAFAAARTSHLKLGTSVLVVPGRNPVLLAKELATLDRLSDGRLLPAFGLGVADPREQQAFGVERGARARLFDEALPLMRRLWAEDHVDHEGAAFHLADISVRPRPVQRPIEVWLGGIAPSELRRVGRLGDGWLPSFCTADEIRRAIPVIDAVADENDRAIDREHFGALVAYSNGALPDELAAFIARRRPDLDATDLVPDGLKALRARLEEMIDAGASKFVVLPVVEPTDWVGELEALESEVLSLSR